MLFFSTQRPCLAAMFASKPIALFFFFRFHSSSKLFFLVFPTSTTSTLPAFSRRHSEFHQGRFYSFISFRVDTTPLASVVSCAYAVLDEEEIKKKRRKRTEYFYCGLPWLGFFIKMLAASCVVWASDEIGCWLKQTIPFDLFSETCRKFCLQQTSANAHLRATEFLSFSWPVVTMMDPRASKAAREHLVSTNIFVFIHRLSFRGAVLSYGLVLLYHHSRAPKPPVGDQVLDSRGRQGSEHW